MTSRIHTDGVLALLVAGGWVLGTDLFDAEVVGIIGNPYTVMWSPPGESGSTSLLATPDWFGMTFQLTHVGGDRREAQWQADRARAVLAGARPTVDGWACAPIEQAGDGGVVTQDTDARTSGARRAWLAIALYRLESYQSAA